MFNPTRQYEMCRNVRIGVCALLIMVVAGCGPDTWEIQILQTENVNTGMEPNPRCASEGERLAVDFVAIYTSDLKGDLGSVNQRLVAGDVTADEWFQKRPGPENTRESALTSGRFWLPPSRIFSLCDEQVDYGTRLGTALGGQGRDGPDRSATLPNDASFFNSCKCILVFPRFIDDDAGVLGVKPALLNSFAKRLRVKIGCDPSGKKGPQGQYIEVLGAS